ncbi:hypothetical protein ES703_84405 [subsurface metagenome]
MFYELRIDCFFADQDSLNDILEELERRKPDMKVIHPGELNQEWSVIDVIKNHHDINPNQPCEEISHWDNCPEPNVT